MKELLLLKYGEIALKGLNKNTFEDILLKNIRKKLNKLGKFTFQKAQSTIYAYPEDDRIDMDEAVDSVTKIFGIAAVARACICKKVYEEIEEKAKDYLAPELNRVKTFKVEAKRADKKFPMTSPELSRELGGALLSAYPHLKVDVHQPDLIVMVEIRDFGAYVYAGRISGAAGMPVGSSGKSMLLLSGGIDSPVAGYMMAKRGLTLHAIHFVSPPYTSDRARQKVEKLCKIMTDYCDDIVFHCVHFTKIQEAIKKHCPEELFTVIMRRMMMKIAQKQARNHRIHALITGESMAQVASQTLDAIVCTDAVCTMPVFRPVIGMDKNEIVAIARKINTFETSIEPYEDCCTVFTPKHPRTKPKLDLVEEAENMFDFQPLINEALHTIETYTIE